jgi:bla regulator protein BlaR1
MTPNLSLLWSIAARELCNHLWQSTLFSGVVSLVALALRRYQARSRYWLWMTASVKFLIPFSLLAIVGSHLPGLSHPVAAQSTAFIAAHRVSQPFTEVTRLNISLGSLPTRSPSFFASVPALLSCIWLLGFVAVFSSWLVQWRRIFRLARAALPVKNGRELESLRRAEHLAKLRRPIVLLSSLDSMEPGVFGILHPVLLWPAAISKHLDDAHLEAVLAHEVCHVQRRDNLTSIVHMLVEAIFWFHPLVWWIETQLVRERERACDEEVLGLCNQPQIYAESILKVCEFCIESPLTCVSGITGADLKKRVGQIMTADAGLHLSSGRKLLLLAAALIAIVLPIALGLYAQSPVDPGWETKAGGKKSFEVASIRPSEPGTFTAPNFGLSDTDSYIPNADSLTADFPVSVYINFAYKMIPSQEQEHVTYATLPKWTTTEAFTIHAKAAAPATKDQMRLMMQSLLAERFGLKVHFEIQEMPVLAMMLIKPGKLGPTLWPADNKHPCDAPLPPPEVMAKDLKTPGRNGVPDGFPFDCDFMLMPRPGNQMLLGSRNASMAMTAEALSSVSSLGRPIVDETGLTGRYDLALQWASEANGAPPGGASTTEQPVGPEFINAMKEQLGIKLEPKRAPVQVLVIDHIETPSAN